MKSITTKPPRSLNLSCLAISTAASKFVFRAVFSIFLSDVFFPEFTSTATSASVVLITIEPPDFNFTLRLKRSFICVSILLEAKSEFSLDLYCFIFFTNVGAKFFVIFFYFIVSVFTFN